MVQMHQVSPGVVVTNRRFSDRERAQREIAELAETASDQTAFRGALFDVLDRLVGFDLASLHAGSSPHRPELYVRGYDPRIIEENLLGAVLELEPRELEPSEQPRPMVDTDVIPLHRRERLRMYRDLLHPHGGSVFTTSTWRNRHGAFGFHLARCGRGRKFRRSEIDALEAVLPAIKLAESYWAAMTTSVEPAIESSFESWAEEIGLSAAERRVTELVVRGLQNREIAALLGVSPLTVRNQLVAVFRKAEVSTRSELAFVASAAEGPSAGRSTVSSSWWSFLRSISRSSTR